MRVALVTTSYPRAEGDPAGHFVEAHARILARAGHEVHVIAPWGSPSEPPRRSSFRRDDAAAVVVHPAGGGRLFGWPGAAARAREDPRRLGAALTFAVGARARLRRLGAVDLVVAHWIVPSAAPLSLGVDAPIEARAHGADVRLLLAMPARLRRAIVARLVDRARFVFAASALRDALVRGLDEDLGARLLARSTVEPAPFELPDVAARAAAIRASGGGVVVAVCGRLVASKRVDLAIEGLARSGAAARVFVVGDGPERAALEGLARRRGVDARFVGVVPRSEALAHVAASDALVHASAVEAAPTVVREARALGVPVVACAAGDVAAWALEDAGITLVEATPRAIAAALDTIASARRGTG